MHSRDTEQIEKELLALMNRMTEEFHSSPEAAHGARNDNAAAATIAERRENQMNIEEAMNIERLACSECDNTRFYELYSKIFVCTMCEKTFYIEKKELEDDDEH